MAQAWGLPLWAHVAAVVGLLAFAVPFARTDAPFTPDEGAYGLQAKSLRQGSWSYRYAAARYDPEGDHFPIVKSVHSTRGWFPYVRHPLFPWLLRKAADVTGERYGYHLLSAAGLVGVAVAAWLVAGELDPSVARRSFWIAALSPALFNGLVIWGHAPSAALSGLTTWIVIRALRRRRLGVWSTGGLVVLTATNCMLRSEAILFGVTLASVVALRERRRRDRTGWLVAAAMLTAVAVGVGADALWRQAIVGRTLGEGLRSSGAALVERLDGWGRALLGGSELGEAGGVAAEAALVALIVGVWAERRRLGRPGVALAAGALVATGLWGWRMVVAPWAYVPGLLVGWPVLVVALGLVRRDDLLGVGETLLKAVLVFLGVVLLAQYAGGGGPEWAARYLSPVQVPLAALVALVTVRHAAGSGRAARLYGWSLLLVVVVPASTALLALRETRLRAKATIEAVVGAGPSVIVTAHPQLPRAAWRTEGVVWMVATSTRDLQGVLRRLSAARVPNVTVHAPVAATALGLDVTGYRRATVTVRLQPSGWPVVVMSGLPPASTRGGA